MKTIILILLSCQCYAQTYILDGVPMKHPKVKDYILWCHTVQDTLHYMNSDADTLQKFHYDIKPIQKTKRGKESSSLIFTSSGTSSGVWTPQKPYEIKNDFISKNYTHMLVDTWSEYWYLCPRIPSKKGFYKWLKWN